jgi:hypothetical protein
MREALGPIYAKFDDTKSMIHHPIPSRRKMWRQALRERARGATSAVFHTFQDFQSNEISRRALVWPTKKATDIFLDDIT